MTDTVEVPSSGLTSRRREATRQKLLDAAALVFAEEGLDAASVEAICERAGFTRGAFYSNFETKDELFLELAGRVARARVDSVRERVAQLESDGDLRDVTVDALSIVQQVLDVSGDDRLAILLMSEIRIHALRDPQLGAAYLAQNDEMRDERGAGDPRHRDGEVPATAAARRRDRPPHADGLGERIGARHDGGARLRVGLPPHERTARPSRAAGDRVPLTAQPRVSSE